MVNEEILKKKIEKKEEVPSPADAFSYAHSIFAPLPSTRIACFLAKVQFMYKRY